MPALGMAQETGVLLQWLKAEGDTVTQGEPLMEVETDKAVLEVEATASGILANVTANPGDEIPVGQVIAVILAPGESAPTRPPAGASAAATPPPSTAAAPGGHAEAAEDANLDQVAPELQEEDLLSGLVAQRASGGGNGPILASPRARRLALERGIELSAIGGSGPGGAVLADDVLRAGHAMGGPWATAAPVPAGAPSSSAAVALQTLKVSKTWRIAADRLTQSWSTVPQFDLVREANASGMIDWRNEASRRSPQQITYTDLLVKIVAMALRRHPRLNATWHEGTILLNQAINVGVAVANEDGLVVPVIHRADELGLNELAARRSELVRKAQAGRLSPAELDGGTFTISNLGMYGVDAFNAIVNPPQAAILAVSRIAERVIPLDGQPAVRPMMIVTLSCDHRVVDGARGAQFLETLVQLIEQPLTLFD